MNPSFLSKLRKPRAERGYWTQYSNHQSFLKELATKLNINDPEDWYKISRKTLEDHGGVSLLTSQYNGSISKLLTTVYSEYLDSLFRIHFQSYKWDLSKFNSSHRQAGWWDNMTNQRTFMNEIAEKLHITNQEGWYKLTVTTLRDHGANTLLSKYKGSPSALLRAIYPEYHIPYSSIRFTER